MCSSGSAGEDEDVIDVYKNKLVYHIPQDVVDQASRNMAGALVRPNGMTKYSQWPVGVLNAVFHSSHFSDANKVVGIAQVQLGENLGPLEEFECRRHEG